MNWLKKHNVERPNKKFINDLTFHEVYEQVTDLAGKLSSYVKRRKEVAIYSNNSVDMALFFLALQLLGKEVLMLNIHLTESEIKRQLELTNVQVVFSDDEKFICFNEVQQSERKDTKLIEEFEPKELLLS